MCYEYLTDVCAIMWKRPQHQPFVGKSLLNNLSTHSHSAQFDDDVNNCQWSLNNEIILFKQFDMVN